MIIYHNLIKFFKKNCRI